MTHSQRFEFFLFCVPNSLATSGTHTRVPAPENNSRRDLGDHRRRA
jgi:hypothetical protein